MIKARHEDILFCLMKDNVVPKAEKLREKYGTTIDVTSLRTRLINYQIETYGNQLDTNVDRQNMLKANQRARSRKNYRRKK